MTAVPTEGDFLREGPSRESSWEESSEPAQAGLLPCEPEPDVVEPLSSDSASPRRSTTEDAGEVDRELDRQDRATRGGERGRWPEEEPARFPRLKIAAIVLDGTLDWAFEGLVFVFRDPGGFLAARSDLRLARRMDSGVAEDLEGFEGRSLGEAGERDEAVVFIT